MKKLPIGISTFEKLRTGYHEKYSDKKVILLGINFDETERNIVHFEWEEI